MAHTYRVVKVYSDGPEFHGASGVYRTMTEAKAELLDIARTWVGLDPVEIRADGSILVTQKSRTITYSILTERNSE